MDNRAGEMQVFAETVRQGSFSAAGRALRLSPSAVSKLVTRLEQRLGVRLLTRTTRALRLTPEGEIYLARANRILDEIGETERMLAAGGSGAPAGRLRVSVSIGFGATVVVPLLPAFLAAYPEIQIDLSLEDRIIDMVEERTDVAIRTGPLRDTSFRARKLVDSPRSVVASPDYLARQGRPDHPKDLDRHNCLGFNFRPTAEEWPFRDPETGTVHTRTVRGNCEVNNGPSMRALCRAGVGIARMGNFFIGEDVRAGRLVPLLEEYNPGEIESIHALYPGHPHLAARIRSFVDFLGRHIGRP